jgi:2-polyprenyl-6-methoxyphenol hydroxylase-like FAD-dependent oxidoreductase
MKRNTFVIIGAGIAGLSAAIALKNIGIDALVVEASKIIRPVGAGLSLAANAIEALRHLKISEEVIKNGRELESFTLFDKYGKVIKKVNTQPTNSKTIIRNFTIHRAKLHEVLLSKISPENILTGQRSISMSETADGIQIIMEDGTILLTKYLIVAEGIHSPLRKAITSDANVRYSGYTCWRGIVDNSELNINETSETWGKEGRFGIVPLANNQIYWFACKNTREQNSDFKNYTLNDLLNNFKDYHPPIIKIIKTTCPGSLIWGDICDIEPLQKFAYGNTLLIGDAAHATTPNMGQGACMAIEDAVILANCLTQNSRVSEAFRSFEKRRLTRTHKIVNDSWRLGKIAQIENDFLASMRNIAFRLMPQKLYERQMEAVYQVNLD